jgi:SnoaL-like domain
MFVGETGINSARAAGPTFIGGMVRLADMEEERVTPTPREEVSDLVARLFVSTDEGRWDDVLACFSPKVLFDMSSLSGVKASRTTPKRIVEQWRSGLKGLAATHHQIGNLLVSIEGMEASAFCYGTATHFLPNPSGENIHTFVGTYDFHLSRESGRWAIDAIRFNLKYQDGNLLLSELAKRASRDA